MKKVKSDPGSFDRNLKKYQQSVRGFQAGGSFSTLLKKDSGQKAFFAGLPKKIYDMIDFISFEGKKGLRPSIFLLKLEYCNKL